MSEPFSLALLEVSNLSPAFVVADLCSKSAGVHLMGIESTDGADQCIKLVGPTSGVSHAAEAGQAIAQKWAAVPACASCPLRSKRPAPCLQPSLGPL